MQNVVVVKCIVWGDVRMATANASKKSGQRTMDRFTDEIKASVRFIQSYSSRYLALPHLPYSECWYLPTNINHTLIVGQMAQGGVLPHIRVGVLPQSQASHFMYKCEIIDTGAPTKPFP